MRLLTPVLIGAVAAVSLSACSSAGEFDETGGVRITRSACPAVAVPTYTGDITLFNPPASRDARAIDVTATITNLKSTCSGPTDPITTNATFDVQARRATAGPARDVVLPYFATVMRGGTVVVSKQVQQVTLRFAEGQLRASAVGTAGASVKAAAATLPADILEKVTRRRKPTDADASIDPMNDPATRAAVARASFELLVGFQMTEDQLRYNATR
ncbi:hypothetical protein [Sphingomonas prati]|uniref:Lipoprotein n=1 Tax=Sphingomonas prati TaxID=1843237 RepID=A0A7W9BSM3_9SPHN|nr:hypothetical protein [Sphingomonas prati]MBB5729280.1 hypothetical protein [Sphingomonas prati]GGE78665.1 hypothetical protein GCM10011404_09220 [Sphingomonas prati]